MCSGCLEGKGLVKGICNLKLKRSCLNQPDDHSMEFLFLAKSRVSPSLGLFVKKTIPKAVVLG